MLCNVGSANNFEYICKFETYFKLSDEGDWINKDTMKLRFYNSGKILKFYDYEIQAERSELEIFVNDRTKIIALKVFKDRIDTFVLNKNTLYAKYQNMFFDNEGGGEYNIGKCTE
tara:strand:+ start:2758 stop:3102 length:345 start_codon:yes stop_codon:yes gene_type:complete